MRLEQALVTGGRGQLGSDLERLLGERGVEARAPGRDDLDITDDSAVQRAIADLRPTVVFNCAAFHNVDLCESEEDTAFAVNVRAVKRLAERCAEAGAKLVHFSTNYVFDGTASEPYTEADRPNPKSVYAISKLAGEHAARAYESEALVVRTAGLYGLTGSASKGGNFVTRAIARAREQGKLTMVADQRLSPTFTADLAEAVLHAVEGDRAGALHLTSSGECSWYEFTRAVMEDAGIDVPIEAVETARAPGRADRPLNGVLAPSAALPAMRSWDEALRDYMARAELAVRPAA